MQFYNSSHISYCTNIHSGESWSEIFNNLKKYTPLVREKVINFCKKKQFHSGDINFNFAIGLRLGFLGAYQLYKDKSLIAEFKEWLSENNYYVFTINGFPYGQFHSTRIKEQVYSPDWSTSERLEYTNMLFDLLIEIAPKNIPISVSSVPGSFKEFVQDDDKVLKIYENLKKCSTHIEELKLKTGRDIHLGLEPEPFGLFENSDESINFFQGLIEYCGECNEESILSNIGINYDTCHFAIEYERPSEAIDKLLKNKIRISKIHISSALSFIANDNNIKKLHEFKDEVYLHQVIIKIDNKITQRFKDLSEALNWWENISENKSNQLWRVHFHVPLHFNSNSYFKSTQGHILELFNFIKKNKDICNHFEIETYTWEVLPKEIQSKTVTDQIVSEYEWCFSKLNALDLLQI